MKPAILALIGLTVVACAPSAELNASAGPEARTGPRQCFDVDRVSNFSAGERSDTLYVRSRGPDRGVFEISGPGCWDLDTAVQLAIRTPGFAGSRACEGESVELITPGGNRTGPCRAHVVRALTEAEVEALPARSRPR